ncbi:ankyrin repeat domain-containing protein [Mesorhizobium sp. LMG 17147]|uniref:ankyrin repeat domain-containing protein n=1 Tax=Mesorhizobium sp. LMG 17147 TaxID=2963091 RepID=UPI0020C9BE35|nr:ankyrin repeat domain-containing protein [Mesorhizobium sp. LMG 17147]MCP9233003.1 ankyrin repeat domain-containing protein [Mesorhizobium sp. LMG 17147]
MRGLLATVVLALTVATAAAADPLFDAVAAGDAAAVERALAGGAAVDSRARDQATPLIDAALGGQRQIAELLIGKGADVMARNSGGFTPLHAAAYSGSLPVVKLLLDHGAVLDDAANKAGVTPMMVAGEEDHGDVVEFLISRGADIGHAEVHGYTPITRAFWKRHADIVKLYKRHGATCQSAAAMKDTEENYKRCMDIHD